MTISLSTERSGSRDLISTSASDASTDPDTRSVPSFTLIDRRDCSETLLAEYACKRLIIRSITRVQVPACSSAGVVFIGLIVIAHPKYLIREALAWNSQRSTGTTARSSLVAFDMTAPTCTASTKLVRSTSTSALGARHTWERWTGWNARTS